MKAWKAIKAGVTGLAVTALSYIAGGCTTGPEYADAPKHLLKYGDRPAATSTERPLEKRVSEESKKSRFDVSDNEFSLIRIKNKSPINAVASAGDAGSWDHKNRETGNRANAGLRVIYRNGALRGIANFQDTYQTANANPDDQEQQDMHVNIARWLFEGGATLGEPDAQFYGGVRAGYEDVKLSGVVDGWGQDILAGAKIAFSSESARFLGMLNINTNLGALDGMGEHNITATDRFDIEIGEDAIPVEGEYGSADLAITLQQGITLPAIGDLYLVAKGSALYQHFENFAKFNTYTLALGVDKRLCLRDGDVEVLAGIEAFGRRRIEDWKNPNAEDTDATEYGLIARLQVEIAGGVYAEMYGMVTRPYDKREGGEFRFGHPEYEAGAQLTLIPGDIIEYFTKDKKKD
ncbi:hypothetical protein KY338_00770 [Candidatus Woesearchaeota archaeon]|nr:hypothetical protein [Candidatus Woesearchaeota archaeon]MBW3006420.1 hypothetical protein [Candidatus Woesearchaeota archaeon]